VEAPATSTEIDQPCEWKVMSCCSRMTNCW